MDTVSMSLTWRSSETRLNSVHWKSLARGRILYGNEKATTQRAGNRHAIKR